MSDLPLHPALVHLPIGLVFIMPLLILVFTFGVIKKWFTPKTWLVLVLLQVVICGSSYMALETGEEQEDVVERVVEKKYIHFHEEKAEAFFYMTLAALCLSLSVFAIRSKKAVQILPWVYLLTSLGLVFMAYDVGHSGGELVYKHNAGSAYPVKVSKDHDD